MLNVFIFVAITLGILSAEATDIDKTGVCEDKTPKFNRRGYINSSTFYFKTKIPVDGCQDFLSPCILREVDLLSGISQIRKALETPPESSTKLSNWLVAISDSIKNALSSIYYWAQKGCSDSFSGNYELQLLAMQRDAYRLSSSDDSGEHSTESSSE
jgi:hypothetical protein